MPLLFIDYTNLVLKAYEERRDANRLSRLLMHPTTANIRQECLNVYNERVKKGEIEEDILRAFFGVPPVGRSYDYVIDRHHADKFRPLRSFIKRKIKNPSLVNVELLAWLIDFNPRPLAYAQTILGITNDPFESVNAITDHNEGQSGTYVAEANLQEIKKEPSSVSILNTQNHSQDDEFTIRGSNNEDAHNLYEQNPKGSSQTRKLKITTIGLIMSIFFGSIYFFLRSEKFNEMSFGNTSTNCMYWAEDHYEKVPCNEERKGRLFLPLEEEKIKNFRRITQKDTITEWSIGKVYYIKDGGIIKYYTEGGNYPDNITRPLKVLSTYMFKKHLDKKEASEKDTLDDENIKVVN